MQPEEIIQSKQWHELTRTERMIIEELANNEHEFNLLKKIMSVSLEETSDVPLIDPAVHMKLKNTFQNTKKNKRQSFIWYAAAIFLVLLIATIFLRQKNETAGTPEIVVTEPPASRPQVDSVHNYLPPSSGEQLVNVPAITQKKTRKTNMHNPSTNEKDLLAVNNTISDNPELLSFITELN